MAAGLSLFYLLVLLVVVLRYRSKLKYALNDHRHLNGKIDKLQLELARAGGEPDSADLKAVLTHLLQNTEKMTASTISLIVNQAQNNINATQSLFKETLGKIDGSLIKSMERIEKSQESSNRILTETIKQMVELSKSQHAASMKTVSEAIATNDGDDD